MRMLRRSGFHSAAVTALLLSSLCAPPHPVLGSDESGAGREDLYSVLGVSRGATPQEVKQAYKRLARANHPDKSSEPGASERFMRINEAYEVLSDAQKRREYDMFGSVHADPRPQAFHTFHASPFAEFFHQHQQQQQQADEGPAFERLTLRQYQVRVAPDSWRRPALLFAIADFCFSCMRVGPLWRRLAEDLQPLGVPMAVVHAGMASNLAEQLRVDEVPAFVGVIDGVAYHYSGELSLAGLRDFYRSLFPIDTLPPMSAGFSAGWPDNRPRVLLAKSLARPPIRFLMAAHAWHGRLAFAYDAAPSGTGAGVETAVVYDEDGEAARLSAARLDPDRLSAFLEANRHLALPRLSSPELAEELCPAQMNYRDKHLCAVLVLRPGQEAEPLAAAFRRETRRWLRLRDRRQGDEEAGRVRLAYAHADTQLDFLRALGHPEAPAAALAGRVLLLWRATGQRVGYRWLAGRWNTSLTPESLREEIASVLEDSVPLTVLSSAPQLADEHRPALPVRLWRRLRTLWDRAVLRVRRTDPGGPLLIAASVAMVIAAGLVMSRLAQWEEQTLRRGKSASHSNGNCNARPASAKRPGGPSAFDTAGRRPDNTRMLVELEPANYRRLIAGSQQGQITLLLVTEASTRDKLAADFARCLAPYAGVERLRFAVLDVGLRLGWYRAILEFVIGRRLGEERAVRPRNCAGTVLAANGFRKYFCIYHPKIRSAMQRQFDCRFLGLHDSDEASEDSSDDYDGEAATLRRRRGGRRAPRRPERDGNSSSDGCEDPLTRPGAPLFERDLLAGLPNWLDRLFEGQLPRVRVDAWPESLDVGREVEEEGAQ